MRDLRQKYCLKSVCTSLFSSSLIIGFCNSLANSSFYIIYLLLASPKAFLLKIYKPQKQFHIDIHHILDF